MNLKEKLTSRKFWACVIGVGMGAAMIFGLDEGLITTISGALTSVASLIVYIVTEGKVDANAAAATIVQVQDAIQAVKDSEDGKIKVETKE